MQWGLRGVRSGSAAHNAVGLAGESPVAGLRGSGPVSGFRDGFAGSHWLRGVRSGFHEPLQNGLDLCRGELDLRGRSLEQIGVRTGAAEF